MDSALMQYVTPELKADPVAWPILDKMSEKDIPGILKSYANAQHRLGSAINLPSKPEEAEAWRRDHLPKLYQSGVLSAPPTKPEEYGITKPAKLVDGTSWSDDLSKELGTVLLKHGAPKGLATDLLTLYEKALSGTAAKLKTSADEGIAALKAEHGSHYEERAELAKRLTNEIFKTPEELAFFEQTGIADHPLFLSVLMRLAPYTQQDTTFFKDEGTGVAGGKNAEEVRSEVADIMSNAANPRHAGYLKGDKGVNEYIDNLYKKAYGTKQVPI